MSTPDVEGRLQTLRTRFAERVNGELDELVRLLEARTPDAAGVQRAREAHQILHRIAGGAGTFGLNELGREARLLELLLQPMAESSAISSELINEYRRTVDNDFLDRVRQLSRFLSDATPVLEEADGREPYLPDEAPAPTDSGPIPQINPSRVILADPDADMATELSAHLQARGYRVQWVPAAAEIEVMKASLEESMPVTVVADARLMDALQDAGIHTSSSFFPIIYLSPQDSFELRYQLAANGAGGFFTRPIDVPLLVERIENQILEHQTARRGRVMLVDDDRPRVMHTQAVLASAGLDVRVVVEPKDILSQLAEFRPDILLLEIQVGNRSGVTLARTIRLQPEWQELPMVFLSPAPVHDERGAGLDTEDVLVGHLTDHALIAAVRSRCYRARRLSRMVSRDSLTGALVPGRIRQEVAREYAQVRRHGRHSVVAIIDLDNFRQINRSYGHPVGDTVIRGLAGVLRQRLRSTDIIGRYGGEEFVVLLPDCAAEHALSVIKDICSHFAATEFQSDAGGFHASISAGLAELGRTRSADAALAAADRTLDSGRRQGRSGVSLYQPDGP